MEDVRIQGPAASAASLLEGPERATPRSPGFVERVGELISEVDRAQKKAEHEARELANGSGRTTETMLALSRAELSLRFVTALRNRAIEAYREIMRLQV